MPKIFEKKIGKATKIGEETAFLRKRRFQLLKKHLFQNRKAEKTPVVTGRLVKKTVKRPHMVFVGKIIQDSQMIRKYFVIFGKMLVLTIQ